MSDHIEFSVSENWRLVQECVDNLQSHFPPIGARDARFRATLGRLASAATELNCLMGYGPEVDGADPSSRTDNAHEEKGDQQGVRASDTTSQLTLSVDDIVRPPCERWSRAFDLSAGAVDEAVTAVDAETVLSATLLKFSPEDLAAYEELIRSEWGSNVHTVVIKDGILQSAKDPRILWKFKPIRGETSSRLLATNALLKQLILDRRPTITIDNLIAQMDGSYSGTRSGLRSYLINYATPRFFIEQIDVDTFRFMSNLVFRDGRRPIN